MNWRNVKEYEGLYLVSDCGKVKSLYSGAELKLQNHPSGYLRVNLYKDGKLKSLLVHRLVVEAFIGDFSDGAVTNHKDGNKKNNAVGNLEIVSQSENVKHAHRTGLIPFSGVKGAANGRAKLTSDDVMAIRGMHRIFNNKQIAEVFHVSLATIERVTSRRGWATA